MNNMTQEEKAKAYDEAVKKLRVLRDDWAKTQNRAAKEVEEMFPELKGSGDERIRQWLIEMVEELRKANPTNAEHNCMCSKAIAWLEKQGEHANFRNKIQMGDKVTRNRDGVLVNLSQLDRVAKVGKEQGEQKSANKVEPKFHEGDWIVCEVTGSVYQINYCIENPSNHKYGYDLINGGYIGSDDVNHYHLWTIKDAKPGDVLCTYECEEPKIVFVLKGTPKKHYALSYYYFYNIMYPHFDDGNKPGCLAPEDSDVRPATKEQCDLLFAKMKEAGYEWDAEKKGLKKIEQRMVSAEAKEALLEEKPAEPLVLTDRQTAIDTLMQTVKVLKERGLYSGLQESLTALAVDLGKSNVVKPAEWSEEDYNEIETIACHLDNTDNEGMAEVLRSIRDKYYHIIPQSTWKPSDEQLKYLEIIIKKKDAGFSEYGNKVLESLYNDLKKL